MEKEEVISHAADSCVSKAYIERDLSHNILYIPAMIQMLEGLDLALRSTRELCHTLGWVERCNVRVTPERYIYIRSTNFTRIMGNL